MIGLRFLVVSEFLFWFQFQEMSRVEIEEDGNTNTYHLIQPSSSTTQYVIDPAFKCEVVETESTEYTDAQEEYLEDAEDGEYCTIIKSSSSSFLKHHEEEEEYQIVFIYFSYRSSLALALGSLLRFFMWIR